MVVYLGSPKHATNFRTVLVEWDGTRYDDKPNDEPEQYGWTVALPPGWPDAAILRSCSHRPGTIVSITSNNRTRYYRRTQSKRRVSWKAGFEPDPNWRTSATIYFEEVT